MNSVGEINCLIFPILNFSEEKLCQNSSTGLEKGGEMKKSSKKEASNVKKAVYAGSFDPPTEGHQWMVEKGAKLFDELVVAVGINPDKICIFSMEERVKMLKELFGHIANVKVVSYKNNLVDYAKEIGADYILRGVRSSKDYEDEREMCYFNNNLVPDIITVFLIPPKEISEVSSSKVKGMIGSENWKTEVERFLPEVSRIELIRKFGG